MKRSRVVVYGADEGAVAETAAGLERADGELSVGTAAAAPDDERPDCLVAVGLDDSLGADVEAPVVAFAAEDEETATAALADGAADYVQRSGGEAYAVLAHRVRRAIDDYHHARDADEATREQYAGIVEALDDGVYALNDDGEFTYVNEGLEELTGYDAEELRGEHTRIIKDHETVELAERKLAMLLSSDGPDEVNTTFELTLHPKSGPPIPCEDHMTVLRDEDGRFRGTAGVIRDITERKRRREMLSGLQETSRALMQAPSRDEVADIVVGAAQRVLGYEAAVVRLYDTDDEVLVPASRTGESRGLMPERPVYGLDEGQPGKVFASGEPAVYDDVRELDDGIDRGEVRSAMYFPIGVHGTLSVGATDTEAFDDIDRQVAALLATNAAAACNRAKREQEVRETRERIATILDRINGLIENTVEVLVEATTREEVEAGVPEQLAAADPYVFAWLGRPDVREETIVAREWAGRADLDVSEVAVETGGSAPGARALAENVPEILDAEALDAADEPWIADARAAGVEAVMAIPLSYTDSSYGVLYVCANRADAFDERERVVLEALGRAVANAINAIESGRILSANKVIELSFTVDDRDLLLSRVSASTDADLASAGTVTQDDGSLRLYLTATGADAEDVLAAFEGDDDVSAVRLVADHEGESLFDVTVEGSLVARLADHGAVPRGVDASGGVASYTVELPYETNAREVFGIVEGRYDNTDLTGYHEHERPVRTQQEFRASLAERFTERQETALRTAYLGGFFEWPRDVDGDELATAMDISRPTYHQHLRAAQQKVFEELFDPNG